MLTPKQEKFCQEYLKDLNATQASIRAGYSEKTAAKIGNENLRKPDIAKKLSELMSQRSERTKIDADWLLTRLADEAEADIADLYGVDGALKPVALWPKIWRIGLVSGVETEQLYQWVDGKREPSGVVTKIKLSDRIKRLELIGKHVDVRAFQEAVVNPAPSGVTIVVNRPDGN